MNAEEQPKRAAWSHCEAAAEAVERAAAEAKADASAERCAGLASGFRRSFHFASFRQDASRSITLISQVARGAWLRALRVIGLRNAARCVSSSFAVGIGTARTAAVAVAMADKLAKRKTNPDNTHRKSSLGKGLVDTQFERFEEAWFNFHRYDADGSGTIDRGELALLLADLRLHVGRKGRTAEQMEEWAKRELKKSDTNGDGVLSFEEFLSYYNAFVARFRSQMEELYEIDDTAILGKGAFGVVVSGVRIDSGKGVAVKRLIKANLSDTLDLLH